MPKYFCTGCDNNLDCKRTVVVRHKKWNTQPFNRFIFWIDEQILSAFNNSQRKNFSDKLYYNPVSQKCRYETRTDIHDFFSHTISWTFELQNVCIIFHITVVGYLLCLLSENTSTSIYARCLPPWTPITMSLSWFSGYWTFADMPISRTTQTFRGQTGWSHRLTTCLIARAEIVKSRTKLN